MGAVTRRAVITVQLGDLRAALTAVRPHIAPDVDGEPSALKRCRLTIDPQNVVVAATDRYSVGMGLVSVWDDPLGHGEIVDVDLSHSDVKDILAMFRPAKPPMPDEKLTLTVTTEALTVTDTSGLFTLDDAKQLRLPIGQANSDFPNLQLLMAGALARARRLADQDITLNLGSLWTSAGMLRRFLPAGEAYGVGLQLWPTSEARSALLVQAGESFLGLLMPQRPDDTQLVSATGWLRDWAHRLPEPAEAPVRMPTAPDHDDHDEDPT